jgi:6-phosphogluconolactonase (cycloisomerase 2 family)
MMMVYVQTNAADRNEVVAYAQAVDGSLAPHGRYETGGRGTGEPHLPSQGSVQVAFDRRRLLVANAGSGDVSVFDIEDEPRMLDRVPSGGRSPLSIAAHGDLVYVLNRGGGGSPSSIAGFRVMGATLGPLDDAVLPLSRPDAEPSQIGFAADGSLLVVTERATDAISVFSVDSRGIARDRTTFASSGVTPYGFDVARNGTLVVTEAFGGAPGAAAASSYSVRGGALDAVSRSVENSRSEVCWAVATKDGRHVYVTNFGDGSISRYDVGDDGSLELVEPVAATTVPDVKGVRDAARSADGRYLYALDADARQVFGWKIEDDGALTALEQVDGLPATAAGLAAA